MRTWILYRTSIVFESLKNILNNNCGNKFRKVILVPFIFFISCSVSLAQWVNNPSENTKVVTNTHNPIDISAVSDSNGGVFLFWQDSGDTTLSKIYFNHLDADGITTTQFSADSVSMLSGKQITPVSLSAGNKDAIIVWKDFTNSSKGALYVQKVNSIGLRLWSDDGIRVTNTQNFLSGYSAACDDSGNTFISYIAKEPEITGKYLVEVQKLDRNGKLLFKQDSLIVYKSQMRNSMTTAVPDDSGGVYIFWIENQNSSSTILTQHINSKGKKLWKKAPLSVSGNSQYVISYSVKKTKFGPIYIVWQSLQNGKNIFHQLISRKGKMLWTDGGVQITSPLGNQINPQAVCIDSTIVLSWTNESGSVRNIYLQKYDKAGDALWETNGRKITNFTGEKFGQKIIADGYSGVIVSWIDRRVDSTLGNIYAQKINNKGDLVWDSTGVAAATNFNTPKSYLAVTPDMKGGAIITFKNKRDSVNGIYAQKIFLSGTYVSQILGFKTSLKGDSVDISWYTANQTPHAVFNVERSMQADTSEDSWVTLKSIETDGKIRNNFYQFYDKPDIAGTIYYRISQVDTNQNVQHSKIEKINYFANSKDIIVAQNFPNPFSDSTKISFYLPKPARVTLEFFNSHVQKISKIDHKAYPAGKNSVTFFAFGLQPGIYFYRFKVGDFVDVKKMVIAQ